MKRILFITVITLLLLVAACGKTTQNKPEITTSEKTTPSVTQTVNAPTSDIAEVGSQIEDIDSIDADLNFSDLDNLDDELNFG